MSEKNELKQEELEKVSGGSHIAPEDIHKYVGRDLQYSWGPFGWGGPYPVHIDAVDGTWVTMTFTDPNNMPKWAPTGKSESHPDWIYMGGSTWKWDYDDGEWYWLE